MKNSLKNVLNALVLLVFIVLAWATKVEVPITPINMSLKINADSTAFVLKNLESTEFKNGQAILERKSNTATLDTTSAFLYIFNNITITTNDTLSLPFNQFIGFNQKGKPDTLSKKIKFAQFTFSAALVKDKKNFEGLFEFKF